ncbi:MAG: hypothetical protein AAF417_07905 [Pseudomonadota bacterium]
MRAVLFVAMFAASLTHAAWNDYIEVRDFAIDAASLESVHVEAGAGSMVISGEPAASEVRVKATITVDADEERARELIESKMRLSLEQDGSKASLISHFDSGLWGWGTEPRIALEVTVPERLALTVDDGAGSIEITNVRGDVQIDDGSGSLTLREAGGMVVIEDGSGSLVVENAGGDVRIVDGSGSINVRGARGVVTVDDGSGGIDVRDVAGDLIIENDGSGGVRTARVGGRVIRRD